MNIYLFFDQLSGSQEARFVAKKPQSTQRKPLYFLNSTADTSSKIVLNFKRIQKHSNDFLLRKFIMKIDDLSAVKVDKVQGLIFSQKTLLFNNQTEC